MTMDITYLSSSCMVSSDYLDQAPNYIEEMIAERLISQLSRSIFEHAIITQSKQEFGTVYRADLALVKPQIYKKIEPIKIEPVVEKKIEVPTVQDLCAIGWLEVD